MNNHQKTKLIDPHLHFFYLDKGNYHWLKPNNPPLWPDKSSICRDVRVDEIGSFQTIEVNGYVHLEAGFDNLAPERELECLEQNLNIKPAAKYIAFADMTLLPKDFSSKIDKLLKFNKCVGTRHILDETLLRELDLEVFKENLSLLETNHLIYELQVDSLSNNCIAFLGRLFCETNIKVVLNHAGFPAFTDTQQFTRWRGRLRDLSSMKNLHVKVSGFEMHSRSYQSSDITQTLEACVDVMGETRVMCASNFPLNTFSMSYENYWQLMFSCVNDVGSDKKLLCYDNAHTFYGFNTS